MCQCVLNIEMQKLFKETLASAKKKRKGVFLLQCHRACQQQQLELGDEGDPHSKVEALGLWSRVYPSVMKSQGLCGCEFSEPGPGKAGE